MSASFPRIASVGFINGKSRAKCEFRTLRQLIDQVGHLLMTFLSGAAEGVQLVVSDSLKTMLSH